MKCLPGDQRPLPLLWEIGWSGSNGAQGFSSSQAIKMQIGGGEGPAGRSPLASPRPQHSHPSAVRTSMCTRSASLSNPATDLGKERDTEAQ